MVELAPAETIRFYRSSLAHLRDVAFVKLPLEGRIEVFDEKRINYGRLRQERLGVSHVSSESDLSHHRKKSTLERNLTVI
jgi:hypothetical protein